jgi:sigma54-dependent transcription regulator
LNPPLTWIDYGLTNSDVEAIEPVRCNPLGDPRELKKEYQRIIAKYPNLSDYIAFGAEREEVLA